MHMETRYKMILPVVIGSLMLTACGGGGGGGSAATDYTGPTAPLAIDANNADTTVAYASDIAASNPRSVTGAILAGVAAEQDKVRPDLVNLTLSVIKQSLSHTQTASTLAGISATETIPCSSGSITGTGEFAQEGSHTSGDSVSLSYNNCVDDWWGWTLNGQLSYTVIAAQGDTVNEIPPWNLATSITMNNFKISYGSQYALMNGGYSFSDGENVNGVETSAVSGSSFIIKGNSYQQLLTDFVFYEAYDWATGETTEQWNFTVASTEIGGRIHLGTTTDFKTSSAADYPYEGVAIVTGKDGSKVQITAQSDATSVQLEYDYDGDGTWDDTQLKTWSELELLI